MVTGVVFIKSWFEAGCSWGCLLVKVNNFRKCKDFGETEYFDVSRHLLYCICGTTFVQGR